MNDDFIDYGQLIDDAMHVIVKQVLELAQTEGLPGGHHFYISFLTGHPRVSISDRLKAKYPDDMTIVLQHQFENLDVKDDQFSVTLSFEGVKERIVVPFEALTAFADPSVKFGLQFRSVDMFEEDDVDEMDLDHLGEIKELFSEQASEADLETTSSSGKNKPATKKTTDKDKSNVVSIDSFRKK